MDKFFFEGVDFILDPMRNLIKISNDFMYLLMHFILVVHKSGAI